MSICVTENLASARALDASIQYVTDSQWAEATHRHMKSFDRDDLSDLAWENAAAILEALKDNDLAEVGQIVAMARARMVESRVSFELTGKAN